MAIFLITLQRAPSNTTSSMEKAIHKHYPNDYLKVGDLAWVVEDKEAITPQNVDSKLADGNNDNVKELGTHIVSSFNGYWGIHENSVWQWLQSRGL